MNDNETKLKRMNRIKKIVPSSVFRKIRFGYCNHGWCPMRALYPNPFSNYLKLKKKVRDSDKKEEI